MKTITVTNTLAELIEDCQNAGEDYLLRKSFLADSFSVASQAMRGIEPSQSDYLNLLGDLERYLELLREMTKSRDDA